MHDPDDIPQREPDPRQLLLIVVGAHPRAELTDRPVAYRLRDRMLAWLQARPGHTLAPLVVSDIWYLNDDELRARPTVSIGPPAINALTAMLAGKLPSAFVVDDVLIVQLDPGLAEPVACCWGNDAAGTLAAAEAFCQRYLDQFMDAATRQEGR